MWQSILCLYVTVYAIPATRTFSSIVGTAAALIVAMRATPKNKQKMDFMMILHKEMSKWSLRIQFCPFYSSLRFVVGVFPNGYTVVHLNESWILMRWQVSFERQCSKFEEIPQRRKMSKINQIEFSRQKLSTGNKHASRFARSESNHRSETFLTIFLCHATLYVLHPRRRFSTWTKLSFR